MSTSIDLFRLKKNANQKISMLTCYDYWSAKIIANSNVDCILVGDSSAMVMHGFKHTLFANTEMLVAHVSAVARGTQNKFIVADMPFCSYRKSQAQTVEEAQALIQAGAQAVKLEGTVGHLDIISHLVHSGIPVMGHIGLMAQSINTLGGYKVQGREPKQAKFIQQQALELQQAGAFALVLECIPTKLAHTITKQLNIATIGIGAGPYTDGQVLVLHDMLGLNSDFNPKFVKHYLKGYELIQSAINSFHQDVINSTFPDVEHHSFMEK
jgi:3-methyl-2-oxobutanoate hydroxymethyltransferase